MRAVEGGPETALSGYLGWMCGREERTLVISGLRLLFLFFSIARPAPPPGVGLWRGGNLCWQDKNRSR